MAQPWQTFPIELQGGLISNVTPLQQGASFVGSATILKNYEPTKDGGYRRIKGYTKYNPNTLTGSGDVLGLVIIDSTTVLAARSNGSATVIYQGDTSSWTSKATAASVGGRLQHAEADFTGTRKTVLVDGVNNPAVYDHTAETVTYLSAPGAGEEDYTGSSCVEIFKQAAFYGNGYFLIFTAPSTIDDFTAASGAGVINVGDTIVGLKTFRDQLIVFCENKILRVTGSSTADYQLVPITEDIGCVDGFTIQEFGGDIAYLGPDGIRLLSATDRIGDFGLDVLSNPIAETAKEFAGQNFVFSSIIQREKAQYRIFRYASATPPQNSDGLCVVKKVSQGSQGVEWSELSGFKINCADSRYVSTNQEIFLFAGSDGYVYQMDNGSTFDGTSIESIFETPYLPLNDPRVRKTIYKLNTYVDTEGPFSFEVNLYYDYGSLRGTSTVAPATRTVTATGAVSKYGTAVYGTSVYSGNFDTLYNTNMTGSGFTVAIRITDNSSTSQYTLDTLMLDFSTDDRR